MVEVPMKRSIVDDTIVQKFLDVFGHVFTLLHMLEFWVQVSYVHST